MEFNKFNKEITKMEDEINMVNDEKQLLFEKFEENKRKCQLFEKEIAEWSNQLLNLENCPESEEWNISDNVAGDNGVSDIGAIDDNGAEDNSVTDNGANEEIATKDAEIAKLKNNLKRSEELRKKLTIDIIKVIEGSQKTICYYQESVTMMEKEINQNELANLKLEEEIISLRQYYLNMLVDKDLLEAAVNELQTITESETVINLLENNEIRLSLLASEKKLSELNEELKHLKNMQTFFDEKEEMLINEISSLHKQLKKLEKEKNEVITTFGIITTYFSEKNRNLKAEMKENEEFWCNNQSNGNLLPQMRLLMEENFRLRTLNEETRKVYNRKEQQLRIFHKVSEQKEFENWVRRMKAERKIKAVEEEVIQLRQKLLNREDWFDGAFNFSELPSVYEQTTPGRFNWGVFDNLEENETPTSPLLDDEIPTNIKPSEAKTEKDTDGNSIIPAAATVNNQCNDSDSEVEDVPNDTNK